MHWSDCKELPEGRDRLIILIVRCPPDWFFRAGFCFPIEGRRTAARHLTPDLKVGILSFLHAGGFREMHLQSHSRRERWWPHGRTTCCQFRTCGVWSSLQLATCDRRAANIGGYISVLSGLWTSVCVCVCVWSACQTSLIEPPRRRRRRTKEGDMSPPPTREYSWDIACWWPSWRRWGRKEKQSKKKEAPLHLEWHLSLFLWKSGSGNWCLFYLRLLYHTLPP